MPSSVFHHFDWSQYHTMRNLRDPREGSSNLRETGWSVNLIGSWVCWMAFASVSFTVNKNTAPGSAHWYNFLIYLLQSHPKGVLGRIFTRGLFIVYRNSLLMPTSFVIVSKIPLMSSFCLGLVIHILLINVRISFFLSFFFLMLTFL
jgi:hypothetical protein